MTRRSLKAPTTKTRSLVPKSQKSRRGRRWTGTENMFPEGQKQNKERPRSQRHPHRGTTGYRKMEQDREGGRRSGSAKVRSSKGRTCRMRRRDTHHHIHNHPRRHHPNPHLHHNHHRVRDHNTRIQYHHKPGRRRVREGRHRTNRALKDSDRDPE